jgi:hypothetical protein
MTAIGAKRTFEIGRNSIFKAKEVASFASQKAGAGRLALS